MPRPPPLWASASGGRAEVLRAGGRCVVARAIAGSVVTLDLRTIYLRHLELIDQDHGGEAHRAEAHPAPPGGHLPPASSCRRHRRIQAKRFVGKLVLPPGGHDGARWSGALPDRGSLPPADPLPRGRVRGGPSPVAPRGGRRAPQRSAVPHAAATVSRPARPHRARTLRHRSASRPPGPSVSATEGLPRAGDPAAWQAAAARSPAFRRRRASIPDKNLVTPRTPAAVGDSAEPPGAARRP